MRLQNGLSGIVRRGLFGLVVSALVAGSLAGCASDWQERYEQSQREGLDIAAQMEATRTQQAQDAAKAESAAAQVKAIERENAKLLAERNDAAKIAREWQAKVDAMQQVKPAAVAAAPTGDGQDNLNRKADEFRRLMGKENVAVTADGNIELTLSSDVTFGAGSEVLSDKGKSALKSLAGKLNGEFATCQIRVQGHTDSDPLVRTKAKFQDNLGLSTARANSVTRYMADEMKIDSKRLVSAGAGDKQPIADNKTAAGKSKNRRVEIVVVTGAQAK
ncbi:MAG: OmpA family protein [Planctomycetes bacterium]|nr:OmpA family protein [Planctomycetota bacterium]